MIRVMIVEDEPPIMRVITKFITSFSEEFKIVHTAMNGKKALELLQEEPVDVIFTDIKMPVMDGLELTAHIRDRLPDAVIVIISGFQDFSYAKTALQHKVYDYLLKPVAPDAIGAVLSKIKQDLEISRKQKQRAKLMHAIHENQVLPAEKEQEKGYGIFLLCAGAFPLIPNDSMLPAKSVWDHINLERHLSDILSQAENSMCFCGKTAAEMVVVFEADDEKRILDAAEKLKEVFKNSTSLPVTLAAAHHIVKINEVGHILEELRAKLYTHMKLFTAQTIWLDKKEETEGIALDTELITTTIYSAMQLGERQLAQAVLTAIHKLAEVNYTELQIAAFFYDALSKIYVKQEQASKDTSFLKVDIDTAISNAADDKALAKDITFILLGMSEKEGVENDKNSSPDIAKQIEEYLQANYKQAITTNMLSKKFGFVPSYISKLFRSYKGMSPSEYLTYYRIEKSKQIMLNEPEILCKEVASRVGFSDQYHFSKTFKKQTGMWPTEYVVKKQ